MTRRTRIALTITTLVVAQLLAVLIYLAVERSREHPPARDFAAQRLSGSELAPVIAGTRADGSAVTITWPAEGARLVHFWATWCEPCRDELPGLLAFARDMRGRGIEVVAIAVDDDWKAIGAFFGGAVPREVMMETDAAAHKRFGVSTLPDTYLVDRSGKLIERYPGARDWRATPARDRVLRQLQ